MIKKEPQRESVSGKVNRIIKEDCNKVYSMFDEWEMNSDVHNENAIWDLGMDERVKSIRVMITEQIFRRESKERTGQRKEGSCHS